MKWVKGVEYRVTEGSQTSAGEHAVEGTDVEL